MTDGFDARFQNWLRWCRGGGYFERTAAGSAEGQYRSPQTWEPDPLLGALEVDVPDAELLNRAYVSIDAYSRRVVKVLWFRAHWRPKWQAQRLGCSWTELPEVGRRARLVMARRVDFLERWHDNRAQQVRLPDSTAPAVNRPTGAVFPEKIELVGA